MSSLSDELDNFINGGNLVVSTKLENYEKLWTDTISYFVGKKLSGVVVSIAKSYTTLVKTFEANKLDTKNLMFIDSVTYNEEKREGNCIYLEKPFNPTYVSIVMEPFIKDQKMKFFIFDSLTSFLVYQPLAIVKFFNFTFSRLSMNNKVGVVFDTNIDTSKKEVAVVAQSCNKLVII
ncbi:MAG: hypothetical protein HYS80_00555 [Candidatus Aenigmarchaeota archaeon]|nr:hypothetical protein [Candidatus Aenigmarchaeota archaeon]